MYIYIYVYIHIYHIYLSISLSVHTYIYIYMYTQPATIANYYIIRILLTTSPITLPRFNRMALQAVHLRGTHDTIASSLAYHYLIHYYYYEHDDDYYHYHCSCITSTAGAPGSATPWCGRTGGRPTLHIYTYIYIYIYMYIVSLSLSLYIYIYIYIAYPCSYHLFSDIRFTDFERRLSSQTSAPIHTAGARTKY